MSEFKSKCWTCRWSVGADLTTTREMIFLGAKDANAESYGGVHIHCLRDEERRVVNSEPWPGCGYEREPGSDDE